MSNPFFIFALPRSRTLWTANLLTFGPSFCYHELLADTETVDEFQSIMNHVDEDRKYVGNCGSDNFLITPQIYHWFSTAPKVFLWRDPEEIQQSLEKCGVGRLPKALIEKGEACCEFVRTHHGMVIDTSQWSPETTRRIWDYCIPNVPYPAERNHQLEFTRSEITQARWKYFASCQGKWPFNLQ